MKRISTGFVLSAIRLCLRRPLWLLAPLAAAPAGAQGPCPAPSAKAWQSHSAGYSFRYYSGLRANGPGLVHCVRNTGPGVYIDWKGPRLMSPVPPQGLILTTSSATRFRHKLQRLFYGVRGRYITVPTAQQSVLLGPGGPSLGARSGAGPFARALAWKPAAAPVESTDNFALFYIPTEFAPAEFTASAGMMRTALTLRMVIERLEAQSDQLRPVEMRFANRVAPGPDGRLTVSWSWRYVLPKLDRGGSPPLFLRFSDSDLHRRMFGSSEPERVAGWGGEKEYSATLPPTDPARLATRQVTLQVLLPDRRTAIASIPFTYSGLRG